MKERRNQKYLFWARVLHPIALIIYVVLCFYTYSLGQYGGVKRKVPIIVASFFILLVWFLWCILSERKHKKQDSTDSTKNVDSTQYKRRKYWCWLACLFLIVTTVITGVKVYESSIKYNGKLSWFLQDLKNKRQVEFTQNNIYEYGLQGIFDAIESKVELPTKLYLSSESDFRLKFQEDGTILSFNTYLYGKNEKGETKSFLISYNQHSSDEITLYLNGYVNGDYQEANNFQLFMDMMELIPLKDTVSRWGQEEYGILYSGVRDWGYNTSGILILDQEGNTRQDEFAEEKIIEYTVSVYVPGKEDLITPARFVPEWKKPIITPNENTDEKNKTIGYTDMDGEEAFFTSIDKGYRLKVVDAALGSRFYSLLVTEDGGKNWETLNPDPFLGDTGVSAGISFIDENLGFIAMSHSGGSYGDLYRTEDGGITYEKISLSVVEASLNEKETYEPYDFPAMPYKEDKKLMLLVGQGQDGDYMGGNKALYESFDDGITWQYKEAQN